MTSATTTTTTHATPQSAPSIDEALRHCRDVTRRRARNFYYGLKLLPEPQRSAMYTVYTWMRRADDLADDNTTGSQQQRAKIEAFRTATTQALAGNLPDASPVWVALPDVVQRFRINPQHLQDMLDGQLQDLDTNRYETFEDLRDYCYRVASTVGLISISIWGYHDDRAPMLAVDRGLAFQLTNILRDFAEDYDTDRVYLPQEDFIQFDLTPDELRRWSKPDACCAMVLHSADRAQHFYDRSAELDAMITPECQPTLWAMTEVYKGLLDQMRSDPPRLAIGNRVRLSALRKSSIALQARFRSPTRNGAGLRSRD